MLCDSCKELRQYASHDGDSPAHDLSNYNLEYLENSSIECDLCHLFYSKALLYPNVQEDSIKLSVIPGKAFYLCKDGAGSAIYSDTFPLCTVAHLPGDGDDVEKGEPFCDGRLACLDSSSPAAMNLVRSWLRGCLNSHDRCNKIKATELPARLLDLSDPASPDMIRLVSTESNMRDYVALSHTWGGIPTFVTTQSNLASRMSSITFRELPKTFQDAVTIARNLGYRYLWIDSICIIQDLLEDWEQESAKMRQVYRGSIVTISALVAQNCEFGILGSRSPRKAVELTTGGNSELGSVFVTEPLEYWNDLLGSSVLNTRGWALQERLLSPRLVHFSGGEILWECLTSVNRERSRKEVSKIYDSAYETNFNGPTFDINMPPTDFSRNMGALRLINEWAGSRDKDPYLTWHKIVSDFSSRDLTYETDRLPAIAGLAAEMKILTGDTYLAGLWARNLLSCLCWRLFPELDASSVTRSSKYLAPSWSWASVNAKVEYFGNPKGFSRQEMQMADLSGRYISNDLAVAINPNIVRARVESSGPMLLGKVERGHISINCMSIPAFIVPDPRSSDISKDHKIVIVFTKLDFTKFEWPFENDKFAFEGIIDATDDLNAPACLCIPIARKRVDFVDNVAILLVVRASEAMAVFRRVGIGWLLENQAMMIFGAWEKTIISLI